VRALCGPSIEAEMLAHTLHRTTHARALSRELKISYATAGVRQELNLSSFALNAIGHNRIV